MEEQETEVRDGVGDPDAFGRLWTPHRIAYIKGENRAEGTGSDGCPFCRIPGMDDVAGLVVRRGEHAYAVLNLYPYNPGHLMLVPYRHVADYADLTAAEAVEIAALTQDALRALRAASGAHGFNVGMNLGTVAGAGIAAHLHQHVVPRWTGDGNFLPIIAHTKNMSQTLGQTREILARVWPQAAAEHAARRERNTQAASSAPTGTDAPRTPGASA